VVDFTIERAGQLAAKRKGAWRAMDTPRRVETIHRVLGLQKPLDLETTTRHFGTVARSGYTIEKLVIERSGEFSLPALLCVPLSIKDGRHAAVLYVDGRGKAADLAPGRAIERLMAAGRIVLSVDLRGYGETADPPKGAKFHNAEFRTAMIAMHVGRPLLGQRVQDLLAALGALSAHPMVDAEQIQLVGVDRAGPVALHAAVLEPRFRALVLRNSIRSWTDDVVARPLAPQLIGHVVPGALAHYDLPDLAAMLGTRLTVEAAE
jgi:hypothetical protein